MNYTFQDKTVWITGASSGLGEAMAKAFAEAGANLILSARNLRELERVKSECSGPGVKAIVPLDLSNISEFKDKVKEAVDCIPGGIDILINNGGVSQRDLAVNTNEETSRKLFEINFFGTVEVTKALLPHFMSRKSGHIVVISSIVGKFGSPLRSTYSASKHALHGYFDSLRFEVRPYNIDVTVICPGFIATNVSVNAMKGDGTKQNTMDEKTAAGMNPGVFARKVLKVVRKKKREAYIGKTEILAVYLKRYLPAVFFQVISRSKVT